MKSWLKSCFSPLKHKKKSGETMLSVRIALISLVIISCLVLMSISAFAYFTTSVFSLSNTLQTARFGGKITVKLNDENGISVVPVAQTSNSVTVDFVKDSTYYIILSFADQDTATTGFFLLHSESFSAPYHTQQLWQTEEGREISFTVTPKETMQVRIEAWFGTSSLYHDQTNPRYIMDSAVLEWVPDVVLSVPEPPLEDHADPEATSTESLSDTLLQETDVVPDAGSTEDFSSDTDISTNASTDTSVDASTDIPTDASTDIPTDVSTDTSTEDSSTEMPLDQIPTDDGDLSDNL